MKNGVPTSAVTVFAISSVCACSPSANRWMNFARSSTGVADQPGSAALAAAAAFVGVLGAAGGDSSDDLFGRRR